MGNLWVPQSPDLVPWALRGRCCFWGASGHVFIVTWSLHWEPSSMQGQTSISQKLPYLVLPVWYCLEPGFIYLGTASNTSVAVQYQARLVLKHNICPQTEHLCCVSRCVCLWDAEQRPSLRTARTDQFQKHTGQLMKCSAERSLTPFLSVMGSITPSCIICQFWAELLPHSPMR